MKRYGVIFIILSLLGVSIYSYLYYSETGYPPSIDRQLVFLVLSIISTNIAGFIVSFLDRQMDRLINWRQLFFTRFFVGFIVTSIGVALFALAIGYVLVAFIYQLKIVPFYTQWHEEIWKLGILIVIILFIYEVFYGWFYSYRYFAITQVDQLRSERWQMELQFESLKSQISPHYLFNCLNTISSLLYKDSQIAEEFIRRMADTFRYVLDNHQQKLVTLKEELAFVKSYYYLMQVRYQEHLKIDINIPSRLMETFVPPLSIQMLLENAVKHNEISKAHPLFIYISAQDNTLINVSSTKSKLSTNAQSLQVGLSNIKNRYKFFSQEPIVVKDIDKFIVQLPVIKYNAPLSTEANGKSTLLSA